MQYVFYILCNVCVYECITAYDSVKPHYSSFFMSPPFSAVTVHSLPGLRHFRPLWGAESYASLTVDLTCDLLFLHYNIWLCLESNSCSLGIYNLGLSKGSSVLKGSVFIEDWFKTSTPDKGHTRHDEGAVDLARRDKTAITKLTIPSKPRFETIRTKLFQIWVRVGLIYL